MEQRKFKGLLIMPLIVIPFIVFFLWVLGIVGPAEVNAQNNTLAQGINTSLPAAVPVEDSSWNKMRFYEQADKDSARMRQLQRQDPYLNKRKSAGDPLAKYSAKNNYQPYPEAPIHAADEQEKKVYEQISQIHRELEKPQRKKEILRAAPARASAIEKNQVDRLERMMEAMNTKDTEVDPEMQQINALMEKIMDVQHPERVKERMEKEEIKPSAKIVSLIPPTEEVMVQTNRFYSLDDKAKQTAIEAVVHETQLVGSGDVVKLRLAQSLFVSGQGIKANEFIYGQAKLNGNRLLITIPFIDVNDVSNAVALEVIGADGMKGIAIHNAPVNEAINNAASRSAQGLNMNMLDNSIGAQVAGAVMKSGKSLIKKQTKNIQYTLPAGYTVRLQNIQ